MDDIWQLGYYRIMLRDRMDKHLHIKSNHLHPILRCLKITNTLGKQLILKWQVLFIFWLQDGTMNYKFVRLTTVETLVSDSS